MIVESLFPEFCNLYGDGANMRYFKMCAPEATFIETANTAEPYFLKHEVDLIYLGSMSENAQKIAIDYLRPYIVQIRALIEQGTIFLCTGNAMEIFGECIMADDREIPALGIFPFHAKRVDEVRYNYMMVAEFEDMKLVGHKSQFSLLEGKFAYPFAKVIKGIGHDLEAKEEGIRYKNFFATYILGPFLVQNPLFVKYLLDLLGEDSTLAFEKEAMEAYENRLAELMQPNAFINLGYHGC